MGEVSSSHQELSGNAQYALGSLCECGDILTCAAACMHKSSNSPTPAAAAATVAAAVAVKAVAMVAVVMVAVAATAAAAAVETA
jgi:hypothetical protein